MARAQSRKQSKSGDAAEIDRAGELLRAGRLVAFPTETVYGLGANALDEAAVARIYAVKGRPSTSPLIVHVASVEMARSLVANWREAAERLARQFWPGPLTLVLEKRLAVAGVASDTIPDIVTAGLDTVGVRMPAHPVALALIRAAGVPLAAPSANRFSGLSPTMAEHVRVDLGSDVDLIIDGGPCEVGIESTVLSLVGRRATLLRPGGISRAQMEAIVGPIAAAQEVQAGAHPSPGMHPRHYSPRTNLYLVTNGDTIDGWLDLGRGTGIYLQHRHPLKHRQAGITIRQMPQAAGDYAAQLYDVLHRADEGNYDWIAIDLPPSEPEWEAIHDRLKRAATK
ncbi:MAG: L-threonylcarbamoyladenylate synthase [Terriglobales bacterium]